MASYMAPGEAATPTTTRRRFTSAVWRNYKSNRPADGGAPTATCLACGLTLCAGGKNGTSHLIRHTNSDKCQRLAAERVEVGRRQPTTSPPPTAAEPSSPGNNDDYYSPSPPLVVVEDEEEKDLFTVDGMYIPELYDKLITKGLHNIEQSNVPAVPQAASSSTRWFINKTKKRKTAENKKRYAPDDESGASMSLHSQTSFNLRGKKTRVQAGRFGSAWEMAVARGSTIQDYSS